jgi:chromosome segregation ATPase
LSLIFFLLSFVSLIAETMSALSDELTHANERIRLLEEERESNAKKSMALYKQQIASDQTIRELTERCKQLEAQSSDAEQQRDRMSRDLVDTAERLANVDKQNEQLREQLLQYQEHSGTTPEQRQRQQEEEDRKLAALRVKEATRVRDILLRLHHNFGDLETYMNATLHLLEDTRDNLSNIAEENEKM